MKRTTRAFAAGMLFATTILAIVHYTNDKQYTTISEQQYEQIVAERNELAEKLEKQKKKLKKQHHLKKKKCTFIR